MPAHRSTEAFPGGAEATLHCAHRDPEERGDDFVRPFFHVAKDEHFALLVGHALKDALNGLRELREVHPTRRVCPLVRNVRERRPRPPLHPPPPTVLREHPARDPVEPRYEDVRVAESIELGEYNDAHIMGGILRVYFGATEPSAPTQYGRQTYIHQPFSGAVVTAACSLNEVAIDGQKGHFTSDSAGRNRGRSVCF
jgi:hypothetical protein